MFEFLFFQGGMDDVAHGTFYKYSKGFIGCLDSVALSPTFELNLIEDADDGINIDICWQADYHTELTLIMLKSLLLKF